MLRNFFIIAIRNMRKHKGNLILNITGLAVGLTSFILIGLYVYHELSYDRFHKNFKDIYRIKILAQLERSSIDLALTAVPMSSTLLNDYPEVKNAVRIHRLGACLVKSEDIRFNEDGILLADTSFFNVFSFKLLRGDLETVLSNPRSAVLSEHHARKYFGNSDPVGKRIILEADTNVFTVTGVFRDIPSNSHMKFDILCSLSSFANYYNNNDWLDHRVYTYIALKDGTIKKNFEARLSGIVAKYIGPRIRDVIGLSLEDFQKTGNRFEYKLEPLKDIHMKGATQQRLEAPGSFMNIYIFSLVALFILAIAIINYINLATAKSAGRAKEVGIRKVSGSGSAGLIIQFIGESLIIVSVAALIAVVMVLLLLPAFNQLTGKDISPELISGFRGPVIFAALILFTGTAAGSYPAFVLAAFNPVKVLKGTLNPGSISRTLRSILVVFQFTVSIVIMIGALVIFLQLRFMRSYDTGINKENLLIIRRPEILGRQIDSFKEQLLQIPGVEKVSNSTAFPGKEFNYTAIMLDDDPSKTTFWINQAMVSVDFPETMGIKLDNGRFFSKEYGNDTLSCAINEAAARLLKFDDPVGKFILHPNNNGADKLRIIGVMKDFNIESLHSEITPVFLTFMRGNYAGYLCVRLNGKNVRETIGRIEKIWADYSGRRPFQYSFFEDEFNTLYETEIKAGKIFILFSILAIFIACLGLIGLTTFMTNIRTREVGIRKSFGASRGTIITLLSREVMLLILISSLIAFPVAWYGVKIWLGSFSDRISVSPMIYIIAGSTALAIGWLSIIYQALKAAGYNPSEALSYK